LSRSRRTPGCRLEARTLPQLHKTILDECWRPAFAGSLHPTLTGVRRELDTDLRYINTHHGRLTRGRIPKDILYGARKMEPR
jgi:hypothetical protein